MSKPKIRFKGYEEDWEQRKLGDVTELKSASRVHKGEWTDSGVPFFRSSDVMAAINGTTNEKAYISEELYEKLSNASGKLEEGDVLVTGGGSVGNPYIVPNNEPLYTKDADLLWIKNQGRFYPYFLYEYFFSPTFRIYLSNISHVGTIAHYTITQLSETPISLPDIEEQIKVGEYFESLDRLITLHQRKCEETKKLKKYMLQKMFPQNGKRVPEIRFAGFTDDWEQRKLGDLVDVLDGDRGKNYPTSDDFDISGHTIFLNASNVTNNGFLFQDNQFITEEKSNNMGNGKLEEDDIVITSRGSLGHIAWYNADISSLMPYARINSGMLILRNKKEIETEYLYHFMKSDKGQSQISFISFGSAQPQLTKKGVEDLKVILPTRRDEQTQLGHCFSSLDHLITLHQRKYEELQKIKKFMLQNMFI